MTDKPSYAQLLDQVRELEWQVLQLRMELDRSRDVPKEPFYHIPQVTCIPSQPVVHAEGYKAQYNYNVN